MNRVDLHALRGAYPLDALSAQETEEFRRHLARCAACAQEVGELRETAARLALAVAEAPPAALRTRVSFVPHSQAEAGSPSEPLRGKRGRIMRITVVTQNFCRGGLKTGAGRPDDRWPLLASPITAADPDLVLGQEGQGWAADSICS